MINLNLIKKRRELLLAYAYKKERIYRLIKEGGWVLLGQLTAVLGSLFLVRVLTELMSPGEYGQLALGLTLITLVHQLLMGGISSGIGRFYSIAFTEGDLWGFFLAVRYMLFISTLAIISFVVIITCALVALNLNQWFGLALALAFYSIILGYNSSLTALQGAMRQRMLVAFSSGLDAWLKIGLVVIAISYLGGSSFAVILGYSFSCLIIIFFQLFFFCRIIPYWRKEFKPLIYKKWKGEIWLFSWPIIMGGIFNWGYYASQRWSLEMFVASEEVGKFYALTQIAYTPVALLGALFMSFVAPIAYSRVGNLKSLPDINEVSRIIFKMVVIGLILTITATTFSLFFSDWAFRMLVAREYRDISFRMPFVVFAAGILQCSLAMGLITSISNNTKSVLPLAIYGQSIIVAINFIFTYLWGISGLTISMVIGAMLHFFWMLYIVLKIEGVKNL